jgi:hypothetical protein
MHFVGDLARGPAENEMHLDDYETLGFACRKCADMVRITSRSFGGAKEPVRESVLFIGTQFSILYTFMYSPA